MSYQPTKDDEEFMNRVSGGYIGYTAPQVRYSRNDNPPAWIVRKFEYLAWKEGLTYYEFLDKYQPSFDPLDWDNDPGGEMEAYA